MACWVRQGSGVLRVLGVLGQLLGQLPFGLLPSSLCQCVRVLFARGAHADAQRASLDAQRASQLPPPCASLLLHPGKSTHREWNLDSYSVCKCGVGRGIPPLMRAYRL